MFKASLDITSKIVTYALMAFAVIFPIGLFSLTTPDPIWLLVIPNAILPVIILFTWLYSPYAYSVQDGYLIIYRKMGPFRIALSDITEVGTLDKKTMGWAIRVMGNGGLFGYTGWYNSTTQGRMRWFVRQRKNYVVLLTKDYKKIVLSPDDPQGLVDTLRSNIAA